MRRRVSRERKVATASWVACTIALADCASAPRNPALDKYPPGINGRTTVIYYDVQGRTFAEVAASMRKGGPTIDGRSFVGETRSPMAWRWRIQSRSGASCTLRDVSVRVNAEITLPRWTPPADAEPGLVDEWNRFLTALELHEAGHKDITARAGREILDRLRGESGSCALLNTRANDVARAIVARAMKEQQAYDVATRHGLTQGTSFGPRRGGMNDAKSR
jgi:predicted secreted Zn-dependent protease